MSDSTAQDPASWPRFAMAVSPLLLALSLFCDSIYIKGAAWSGWMLFLGGAFAVWSGSWAWLANPILCVAWFATAQGHRYWARALSILTVLLMISFLFQETVITSPERHFSKVTGYGIGYWIWILSGLTQLAASFVFPLPQRNAATAPAD